MNSMISKPSERNGPADFLLVRQVQRNSQFLSFFSPFSTQAIARSFPRVQQLGFIYIYIRVEVGGDWRPVVAAGLSIYKYIRGSGGWLGKWNFHASNNIQQSAATNTMNNAGLPSSTRLRYTRTLHLRIRTRRRLLAR